jgi:NAD(P)-dependent dehydrogenase (short-subunit alcohol dehydrogenase family)
MTGGSHGIGEKTIALFMQQGWSAINISRTNCMLPNVNNINIDLSQDEWPTQVIEQLQKGMHHAEKVCLVHNAALFKTDSIHTLSTHDFRTTLNINLIAPVILNQIILPFMKKESSIIYIGSTLSEQAVPDRASYVISKHAIIGLMRATCQDLVDENIHTCCICPGFVDTQMLRNSVNMDEFKQFIQSKVIARRLIEPEEIAAFIYFAALNPVVNGAVMHANLGQVSS